MTKIADYNNLGQSIWCDYLRRSFIDSGELQSLIEQGLSGVTSNPTIFEKAIAGSTDYDADLKRLVDERKSIRETYESLALEDISRTATLLKPVFDSCKGTDGFVSMEVDPKLANDTKGMVDEARRFFRSLDRPNVMIKIPATQAGFPAIKSLTSEGINVNVTLIFSLEQYEAAAEAYLSGLEKFAESGGNLSQVASVASFFVSRVDTSVDKALDEKKEKGRPRELKGKIGIANAKVAYARFGEIFGVPRWEKLKSQGAKVQRILWGSTSTKNPEYPDTLYVDNLVGPETVNTLPPATIQALLDHGRAQNTIQSGLDEAREQLKRLSELDIDLGEITEQLEEEAVQKFSKSIDSLFGKISQKRERFLSEPYLEPIIRPVSYLTQIDSALNQISSEFIVRRIWNQDHTVWKSDPSEISNRLGWLRAPEAMEENAHRIEDLVDGVRASGYTQALLLGMGGSSLAPEVFTRTFGTSEGFLGLSVLDSTDPATIESHLKGLDLAKTLFIVSTKSGKTIETLSLFKFFYNKELEHLRAGKGTERRPHQGETGTEPKNEDSNEKYEVGQHFVAITDPGSEVESIAIRYSFRGKFLNDPNIGGRYSALSYFGLVPAALIGVDVRRLLDNALTMSSSCESCVNIKDNPGAWLGTIIGELAVRGRDKLTFVASPGVESLCDWIEQLIAESTGKEGRGILPVVGEELGSPHFYENDRLFVYIRLGDDRSYENELARLESLGFPVVRLRVRDPYEIGKQFFQWEFATSVAGHILGINPFDQPNVESAKELARRMVSTYLEKGTFPPEVPALTGARGLSIFGHNVEAKDPVRALVEFVGANKRNGSYISLQAYLQQNPETERALQEIRTRLRDNFKLATTLGYGPRFLHSTGQLHKGDAGLGLFVQFTCAENLETDIPIPDEPGTSRSSLTFGVVKAAEALGDRKALEEQRRSVIRIHLGDVDTGLNYLRESLTVSKTLQSTSSSDGAGGEKS
ncbi:MAG: transaldolase [Nitrososphaerales archaeon]